MSPQLKPQRLQRSKSVTAILRGRYVPPLTPIIEVASADGSANVGRTAGQSLTELADDPSPRLVNLLEQQNPRSVTTKADARRVQKLLKSSAGVRSVLRSR